MDSGAEERHTATIEMPGANEIQIQLSCSVSAPSVSQFTFTSYTATATALRMETGGFEISTYTKR